MTRPIPAHVRHALEAWSDCNADARAAYYADRAVEDGLLPRGGSGLLLP